MPWYCIILDNVRVVCIDWFHRNDIDDNALLNYTAIHYATAYTLEYPDWRTWSSPISSDHVRVYRQHRNTLWARAQPLYDLHGIEL